MSNELNTDQMDPQIEENETQSVYELGFHFIPTIAEDEVPVQFSHLKALVEKRGGEFISEDFPKLRDLAYEITKDTKGQKKRYSKSYFGWIKFTLEPDQVIELEKEVKAYEPMLRYLLVKTVRENTLTSIATFNKEGKKGTAADGEGELVAVPAEMVAPPVTTAIDEAQVDKSIEELVKE